MAKESRIFEFVKVNLIDWNLMLKDIFVNLVQSRHHDKNSIESARIEMTRKL